MPGGNKTSASIVLNLEKRSKYKHGMPGIKVISYTVAAISFPISVCAKLVEAYGSIDVDK